MRGLFRWCLPGLALAFTLGCLTTPPRAPLTVELFDSRAAALTALSPFPLAAPTPPEPSAPVAPAVAAAPVTAPTLRADLGFLIPPRPRVKATFSLAAPEVPPATVTVAATPAVTPKATTTTAAAAAPKPATTTTTTTATAPKPATTATTAAAASTTATTAPTTTPAASTTSPATTAAASTAASTGSGAGSAAAPSYGTLREIYARVGDQLQVGLDGLGFLFLGFPDKSALADGMSFKSKENRSNKTWFTFQALKIGVYDLDFLQQDNTTGKSVKETVRVHVVNDQDFSAATQQGTSGTGTAAIGEPGDTVYADTLVGLGQYTAALSELLKGYVEGNPSLNDRIASLYVKMNNPDAAVKYYTKNLSPQNPFTPRAVDGLMRIAALRKDQVGIMANLKQFLALKDGAGEETFLLAARLERDTGQVGVGLQLLAAYATSYPQGGFRDEADFIAGQLLEADSPFRDIAQARALYSDLLTSFPESDFAEAARQRVLYIDRHFLQVR